MARRTHAKIEAILREHVRLDEVEIAWRRICRQAREVLGSIPDRALKRIPTIGSAGRAVLAEEIAAILAEVGEDDGAPLPAIAPEEKPPTVTRSHILAEARAQAARLQTALMDLKARIGHYPERMHRDTMDGAHPNT